jgi:hypothetical protein
MQPDSAIKFEDNVRSGSDLNPGVGFGLWLALGLGSSQPAARDRVELHMLFTLSFGWTDLFLTASELAIRARRASALRSGTTSTSWCCGTMVYTHFDASHGTCTQAP